MPRVNATSPPFATEPWMRRFAPASAFRPPSVTRLPAPPSIIDGRQAWLQWNAPSSVVVMTRRQSS